MSQVEVPDVAASADVQATKPPPMSKGFVLGLVIFFVLCFGIAFLWLSSLRPLGGMSSSSAYMNWGPQGVNKTHSNAHGLTILTNPKPGTKFGYTAEVTNYTGVKVTIDRVTTSWQYIRPAIVSAKSANSGQTQLVDGQWRYGSVTLLPSNGVTVQSENSGFVGQAFVIPECAVKPSADKNLVVQMGPMHVTYTYAWFFHRTVTLPPGTWWAIKAPNHC